MKKYLIFTPLLFLISCSSELYQPIQGTDKVSLEDLKEGRVIYVKNCASCHQLFLPAKFNNKEWETNLNKMQNRAAITDAEKQLVYQYLVSAPKK